MIVGVFCDSVIEELGYHTSEKSIDRRNVQVRAAIEHRTLLAALVYGGTYLGQGVWRMKIDEDARELPDSLFITKAVPVQFDATRNRNYVTVPSPFISFENNNGIRWVCAKHDTTDYFISQRSGASGAYNLLESAMLAGMKGYEIELQSLWMNNFPPNVYQELLITYLPALEGLKETDILPMPGEIAKMLADAVVDSFKLKRSIPINNTVDSVSE